MNLGGVLIISHSGLTGLKTALINGYHTRELVQKEIVGNKYLYKKFTHKHVILIHFVPIP